MNPRVAVIILGYNDEHNLKDAIESTLAQSYSNFELIYVDNASKDNSLSLVQSNFPQVRCIAYQENLGYAGGYQQALPAIFSEGFDCAVLLNSDVVVEKNWLEELVKSAYKNDDIAIAQPKIFLWDNKNLANTFGNRINFLGFGFCDHYKQEDSPEFNSDRYISSASGASLLIKKEAYQEIGGLDESFFAYLEDQDLSLRAIAAGYKIVLSANAKMWHKYVFKKNQRNHWKFFTLERNRLYFLYKNYPAKLLVLIFPMFIIMELGVLADATLKGYLWDKIRAYGAFFKNFEHIHHKRQITLKQQKLSNSELFEALYPTIEFEEIDSLGLRIANLILKTYYSIINLFI